MLMKNDVVYLENEQHRVVKYPLSALTAADKSFVLDKCQQIKRLNHQAFTHNSASRSGNFESFANVCYAVSQNAWLVGVFVFLLVSFVCAYQKKEHIRYVYSFLMFGFIVGLFSFAPNPPPTTDPLFVDSAFVPFKSKIKTRWDATYFYVESQGIPTHPMMAGITNWQQQVPTPKCYVGPNAWSIPLNPVVAATPVPTASNFFKGAIAIAANGVPIFNALNNRGEDSYLIGELDAYGGHCGKGDDYHYHTAPLSLDDATPDVLPIAFALDGYAIYAAKEPNGTAMTTLDANHGHYLNNVYHYHGTTTYPYAVGNMVGVVTKDATDQIIPQPSGTPIRPAGNPLNGAAITSCVANGTNNGYNLTYKLSSQNYQINYNWTTSTAAFTFNFVSPTNVTTTANYTGTNCVFVVATPVELTTSSKGLSLKTTVVENTLDLIVADYKPTTLRISNVAGQVVLVAKVQGEQRLDIHKLPSGLYFIQTERGETARFVKQ